MVAQRGRPQHPFILIGLAVALVACQPSTSEEGSVFPSVQPSASASGAAVEVIDAATATMYDPTEPVALQEGAVETRDNGVTVTDVNWASATGERVTAWLVVPPGEGPFAGLVYLHGSETDRDDFLDEAEAMATGGAVSLVLDAPFSRVGTDRRAFLQSYGLPERERDMTAQAIIDVRRAYDILVARGDVDPDRLGYVGHSWGASAGATLAAVDERPAALILIAPRPSWTGFLATSDAGFVAAARALVGAEKFDVYLEVMAPFDAMAVADLLDGERIYLQYGTIDEVVPPDVAQELIEAVPDATLSTYEAEHALDDAATADRAAWLVERLSLGPISPATLATVGLPDE
jgi:cephalosporin-C deacetylase-like acetyl esterase